MIDQATIDRIMDAAQIVDVVSEAKEYANVSVAGKEGT